MELAPIAADLFGFTAAVQKAGFNLALRDGASVDITISPTEKFIGVFAYDNIAGTSGDCGVVSISEAVGAPNDPGYSYGINCANGAQQKVVPYVQSRAFFRSVAGQGFTMSTDRNTGVITIPGEGRFKPSFFVSALTAADQAYLDANKDAQGVAFRFLDLTGNGVLDALFYTASGVQAIYRVAD